MGLRGIQIEGLVGMAQALPRSTVIGILQGGLTSALMALDRAERQEEVVGILQAIHDVIAEIYKGDDDG